jgi:predicted GH43/DUF377 family glycosyl hydrolase
MAEAEWAREVIRMISRREFLKVAAAAPFVPSGLVAAPLAIPNDLQTPYKLDRLVVGPSRKAGSFDELSADVPFVFRHQELFYLTYVGFDGVGYQTGLASSGDLTNWHREGVILRRQPSSPIFRYNAALTWILRENDVFGPGELKRVMGRYLGVYHAYPKPGYEAGPAVIGLCWSDHLRNWELEDPCLRPEDGAEWERGGLYKACLVEDRGVYHLFYNAKTSAEHWHEQTGVAISRDLKTWVRNPKNPILKNGPASSVDAIFASDPCVLKYRDQWAVFYYSLDRKGVARDLLALSPDLNSTRKCDGVLIDVGAKGTVDSTYAHKPSVISHDDTLYHFYCAVSEEFGRGISVAASKPWSHSASANLSSNSE